DNVQIYSITIDPDYDTPDQLAEYSLKYNASPDKLHFLNGPKEQTYDLVRCGFALPLVDGHDNADGFGHSGKFIVGDGQGGIRGYYSGTTRESVDKVIRETNILLHGMAQDCDS